MCTILNIITLERKLIKFSYYKFISIVRVTFLYLIGNIFVLNRYVFVNYRYVFVMEKNKQFVQVPNLDLKEKGLEMKDLVVYAYLRKHYNNTTKDAFPSFSLLVEESGISKPTIMRAVDRLEAAGYIEVKKDKKVNHYKFSDINKFEIYSFDFLDDQSLSVNDKAYIVCMQPHMFKNSELGIGKVTYSELDIAKMLNIDLRTLRKYEQHLQQGDKPVMSLVPTKKKDPQTGLTVEERIFDFEAYNNILALKFTEIDQKLEEKVSKTDYDKLLREFNELKKIVLTQEVKPEQITV